MYMSVKIRGVTSIRERAVIVATFNESNCPFEARTGHFWDPDDPLIEHGALFEPDYWERNGLNMIETDFPIGYKGKATRWRGSDDVSLEEQVKSVGILGYSRTVPEFMGTVLACANISDEPVKVAVVSTTAEEPPSGGSEVEDTTPFTVKLKPVGDGRMWAEMRFRPFEYRQNQSTWYRCYAETTVHGIAGMEDSVILVLFSERDCAWESRQCIFYEQWKALRLPPENVMMTLNCLMSPGFNTPPGYTQKAGGWLADRNKMVSVGAYNYKTRNILSCANIPPPRRQNH
jgi:hypothetical protein